MLREEKNCQGVQSVKLSLDELTQKYKISAVVGRLLEYAPTAAEEAYICEVWTNVNSHTNIINVYSLDYS